MTKYLLRRANLEKYPSVVKSARKIDRRVRVGCFSCREVICVRKSATYYGTFILGLRRHLPRRLKG